MAEEFKEREFGIERDGDGKLKPRTVARAWAQWYLGNREWASQIIDVYEHPERYLEILKGEVEA